MEKQTGLYLEKSSRNICMRHKVNKGANDEEKIKERGGDLWTKPKF